MEIKKIAPLNECGAQEEWKGGSYDKFNWLVWLWEVEKS